MPFPRHDFSDDLTADSGELASRMSGGNDATCGFCSICLSPISAHDETFVNPCFHHFCYKCIKQWSVHHAQDQGLLCPLCRRPYTSLITDCHGSAFRQEMLHGVERISDNVPGSLHLTVEHRRRRAAYDMIACDYEALPQHQSKDFSRSANAESSFSVHLINRPDVAPWTKREIQALLLQDDVEIFVHQALGALKSRQRSSRTVLSAQEAEDRVALAMDAFLLQHSRQFAHELVSFVASGRSLRDWDAEARRTEKDSILMRDELDEQ